jgi:hypothetical protein
MLPPGENRLIKRRTEGEPDPVGNQALRLPNSDLMSGADVTWNTAMEVAGPMEIVERPWKHRRILVH